MPIRFEQLPFVVRVVWDPIRALDLVDERTGHPDHGKTMPAVVLACVITAQFVGRAFGIATILAVLAASFGAAMFRTFLNTRTVTVQRQELDSTTTTLTGTVAPRDTAAGIQPTSN